MSTQSNTNDANVETVLNKISITEAKATMMLTAHYISSSDIQSSAAPLDDVFLFGIYHHFRNADAET